MNIDQLEQQLKEIPVTQDQYDLWKENVVTKRLMIELKIDLLSAQSTYSSSGTIEEIAKRTIKTESEIVVLENVLKWKPVV